VVIKPKKKKEAVKEDPEAMETPSSDDENPHGFVYSHNLDTYRRNKRERLAI
jgi:hypothetical protein